MGEPVRHTKYSHLSDGELLTHAERARESSPIIEELCQRLERSVLILGSEVNHSSECPACESPLNIDYDQANHMFTVEVQQ